MGSDDLVVSCHTGLLQERHSQLNKPITQPSQWAPWGLAGLKQRHPRPVITGKAKHMTHDSQEAEQPRPACFAAISLTFSPNPLVARSWITSFASNP